MGERRVVEEESNRGDTIWGEMGVLLSAAAIIAAVADGVVGVLGLEDMGGVFMDRRSIFGVNSIFEYEFCSK